WLFGVLLAVLLFFASSYHFHPRPHLATIVLMGWTFARLCDVENGRRSLRSLIWLVPVFILWTNLHGGVLGGVATVGCVAAGWPRITWLIPLIWLYLACRSIRHGPLFAVTACVGLADLLPQTRFANLLKKHAPDLYVEPSAATPSIANSRFSINGFQLKAFSL